jgi:hypothetical protein
MLMQAVDLDLHVPHLFLHMRSLGGQGEAAEETEKVDEGPVKDADGWEEPFRGLKRLGALRNNSFSKENDTIEILDVGIKLGFPISGTSM